MDGIRRWRDAVVAISEADGGPGGCPITSLASELADHSESARELLMRGFQTWESHLARGLRAMQERGELSAGADPVELATSAICAVQGGLLPVQTQRAARPVRVALNMALGNIERHLTLEARPGRLRAGPRRKGAAASGSSPGLTSGLVPDQVPAAAPSGARTLGPQEG